MCADVVLCAVCGGGGVWRVDMVCVVDVVCVYVCLCNSVCLCVCVCVCVCGVCKGLTTRTPISCGPRGQNTCILFIFHCEGINISRETEEKKLAWFSLTTVLWFVCERRGGRAREVVLVCGVCTVCVCVRSK